MTDQPMEAEQTSVAPLVARAAEYRWSAVPTPAGMRTVFTLTNGLIDMVWAPPAASLRQLLAELGTIVDAANRAEAGLEVPDVAVTDFVNGGPPRPNREQRRYRERPSHFRPQ